MKTRTLIASLLAPSLPRPLHRSPSRISRAHRVQMHGLPRQSDGGGKRNEFGSTFSQTALPAERLDLPRAKPFRQADPNRSPGPENSTINSRSARTCGPIAIHGRPARHRHLRLHPRAQAYLEVKPIADRLTIYLDERVSPGAATNRETYAMLWFADRTAYVKAGRMFVPFGLRIEDDSAFIRQVTGTSFNSSDDGVEGARAGAVVRPVP